MNRLTSYTVLLLGLLSFLTSQGQFNPEKVCRIENGRVVFSLNLKWSAKEQQSLTSLFDLDSTLIARVYSGKPVTEVAGETWKVKKVGNNLVELSKAINAKANKNLKINDLFLVIDQWMNFNGNPAESTVIFGVNNLKLPYVFTYSNDKAIFYLPAYHSAKKVYISGSFNDWSTSQTPMGKVNDGWMAELPLKPGKYLYKYIVDGKWTSDPNNNLKELGGAGTFNSVVYGSNHLFRLKGFRDARNVVVTGNFYNWKPNGIRMNRTDEGWSLPVYLRDGTYAYKFLVDHQWMTDPGNQTVRPDGNGNLNSFIEIGKPFLFKLNGYTSARKVILSGSFNGWNGVELVMDKTATGWQLPYVVSPGNYEYKFIVDGKWITDPANPFRSGSGDKENSFIALKANHFFELRRFPDARKVIVTGSFNGWNTEGYKMIRQGEKWILPLYLSPGKYTYKFIVDGTWILDPNNELYEQNEYGTNNSVLWKEP